MELQEKLKEIKTRLRLSMNGTVAQSMREKGLNYKINFGVELPRLREIARTYEKDHDLAQALWKEEVRESKILAGIIQPTETFFPEIADIWMENIHSPEIAELTCMNLFQNLPYAPSKAFEWMADEREYHEMCGFLLMARLLGKNMELSERAEAEFLDQAFTVAESQAYHPRKAALLALKKFALRSKVHADKIIKKLAYPPEVYKEEWKALCEEIKFEKEYLS